MNLSEKTKDILEWIACIIIALILAMLFRYFIGTPTIVKQVSMYPTLVQDERLWLNRWGRTVKALPKRGEIITFEEPLKIVGFVRANSAWRLSPACKTAPATA